MHTQLKQSVGQHSEQIHFPHLNGGLTLEQQEPQGVLAKQR